MTNYVYICSFLLVQVQSLYYSMVCNVAKFVKTWAMRIGSDGSETEGGNKLNSTNKRESVWVVLVGRATEGFWASAQRTRRTTVNTC